MNPLRRVRFGALPVQLAAPLALASLALPFARHATAQQEPTRQAALRVFLDCGRCDFDHLRREVPIVDYVRDPADADVHVIVTTQETGSGGDEFTFYYLGLGQIEGMADTLRYVSRQTDTEGEVREGYTHTFRLGLVRYLAYLRRTDGVDVVFEEGDGNGRARPTISPADDPWDLWVFRASVGAELEGESRQEATSIEGSFSASRTTEELKIDMSFRGDYQEEEFELQSGEVRVESTREIEAGGTVVWSLGPNWSWGVTAEVGMDQSVNQSLFVRAAPAIEFSLFPYSESTRRQITATYRIGLAGFRYEEPTIFFRTRETRPEQSLEISADFVQPWGDLVVSLEGSHFLDDPSRHRVDLFTLFEFRIFRGLNLDVRANVARIKDQIYLSAEGLDDEEILIGQRERGTDYEYSVDVGFSFTFGSVFNNVVNPRLRTGGGDFD
ncbi:MAG TPA: hypothetical protein VFQ22_11020 [Longimicrobiales bacterium]|nr:hypothetical protein [Longimicrobiales bacterium]